MKRKYSSRSNPYDGGGGLEDGRSEYGTLALESTMMLETGGFTKPEYTNSTYQNDTSLHCIGKLSTISVNASLSSGTRLFQYNRFYWNKDIYSFNYNNCCIFVAIAYYRGNSSKKATFLFYPIFLPRTALTTFQNIQNDVTIDPAKRKYLIDDLLYYLNGAFTSFNFDASSNSIPDPGIGFPTGRPLESGPTLYCDYLKGFLKLPTDDHTNFPIFQDDREPPLKFIYVSSNNQIALIKNSVFWDNDNNYPNGASIAFQFVTPEDFMAIGTNNPSQNIACHRGGSNPTLYTNSKYNIGLPSLFDGYGGNGTNGGGASCKGWCGQGVYGLGFGLKKRNFGYSDVYETSENRLALFKKTNWDTDSNLEFSNTSEFLSWAADNKLETFIVMATKICSLLPSRFFTVQSDVLTRDQKVYTVSNNPAIGKMNVLNVYYMTLDKVRTKIDETLSGQSGFSSSSASFSNPVVHFDPLMSIQSVDIIIQDEWDCYLQNYRTPSLFNLEFKTPPTYNAIDFTSSSLTTGNYISYIEGEYGFNNGKFTIPAWLAAMNPSSIVGNTNPIIAPFSTYLNHFAYFLYLKDPTAQSQSSSSSGFKTVIIPPEFSPNIPFSGNIIHFGRIMGY